MTETRASERADTVFVDYLDNLRAVARWPVWSHSPGTPPEAAFSIREIPGKGKGMIARRAIKGGELIWSERPIYAARRTLTCASDQTDANGIFYRAALQKLSAASRRAFFELGSAYPQSEFDVVPGILNTNCLEISISDGDSPGDHDPDPHDSFAGLFPTLSRANHSCRPSANYYFSVRSFTGQLWATEDISPGEEITITYTPLTAPRMERRAFLARTRFFLCSCPACAIPTSQAETSDRRRIVICELLARLQHTQYPPRIPKEELEQILEWAAAERMMVEYAKVLLFGSQVFTLYGEREAAAEWAARARSAFRMVEGEWSHHLSR
ncbi:SET domain-containing protein [Cubamyces menziesii]|nr:SET domain-containing protein [Cubamyces menziesii]